MKKTFFLAIAAIVTVNLHSQVGGSSNILKKVMTLQMPLTADDEMPGRRGAGVIWHPLQKKYYAAMAGNIGYPLAIFDSKGTRLSADTLVCKRDVRGLWYNPDTKEIQGNEYSEYGWFRYVLDAKGTMKDYTVIAEGQNQPDAQSVGAYNYKSKKVLFLFEGKLYNYDITDASFESTIDIYWGTKNADISAGEAEGADANADTDATEGYNKTSLVYTGITGAEVGFLNVEKKQIELYNYSTGYLSKVLALPDEAIAEPTFNFAYSNGIYWLFDMDARIWYGYK